MAASLITLTLTAGWSEITHGAGLWSQREGDSREKGRGVVWVGRGRWGVGVEGGKRRGKEGGLII